MSDYPLLDPISRQGDPDTSRRAEREITQDGTRSKACQAALTLVKMFPGMTSNELENQIGVSDGRVRKRLRELERRGLIRRGEARVSEVTGKVNVTWWLA